MIKDHLQRVFEEIDQICQKIGRNPQDITLVGVTKFAQLDEVNEAIGAGLKHVGENKVQQAQSKFPSLDENVTRHMIGHLQTNKVKDALEIFDIIQSVDSIKLINEIEKRAAQRDKTVDVLLQVNTSGEEQKFGCAPDDVASLTEQVSNCSHLRLQGFMTIAPLTNDEDLVRRCFKDLREVFDSCKQTSENIEMKYLSMGMSSDYKVALEEGANMLRIGSAIFK